MVETEHPRCGTCYLLLCTFAARATVKTDPGFRTLWKTTTDKPVSETSDAKFTLFKHEYDLISVL